MKEWAIFFIVILSVAFFVTVALIVKLKNSPDDTTPSSTGTVELPTSSVVASSETEKDTTPPADIAVIYERVRSNSRKYCENCGCEFDSTETTCEICGSTLRETTFL